ncbi:MAG: hypothetical protein M3Y77_14700 [Actinomycetota bacterium]|nr:hypothetical protein [Actinomycetota bacterium]
MPALPMSSRPDGGVVAALGPGPIDEPDGDDPDVAWAAEDPSLGASVDAALDDAALDDAVLDGAALGGALLGGALRDCSALDEPDAVAGAGPVMVVSSCPGTCSGVATKPVAEVQPAASRHTTASTSFDPARRLRPLATTAR